MFQLEEFLHKACSNIIRSLVQMEAGNLDRRKDTADNEGGRNKVLGGFRVEVRGSRNDDGGSDDTSQHSECLK
jgi:hypothetical protein